MSRTSDRVASLAAKGLADPASLKPQEVREVCASALAQADDEEEEAKPNPPAKRPSGPGFKIDP